MNMSTVVFFSEGIISPIAQTMGRLRDSIISSINGKPLASGDSPGVSDKKLDQKSATSVVGLVGAGMRNILSCIKSVINPVPPKSDPVSGIAKQALDQKQAANSASNGKTAAPTPMSFIQRLKLGLTITITATAITGLLWYFAPFAVAAVATAVTIGFVVFTSLKVQELVVKLKTHMQDMAESNADLKLQIATIKASEAREKEALKTCQEAKCAMQAANEEERKKTKEAQEQLASAQEEFTKSTEEKDALLQNAQSRLQDMTKAAEEAGAKQAQLSDQLEAITKQNELFSKQIEESVSSQQASIQALQESLQQIPSGKQFGNVQNWSKQELEKISNEMTKGIESIKKNNQLLPALKVIKISEICAATTQKLTNFQVDLSQRLQKLQETVEKRVKDAETKLETVKKQNGEMRKSLQENEKKEAEMRKQYEELQTQVKQTKDKFDTAKKLHEAAEKRALEDLQKIEKHSKAVASHLSKTQSSLAELTETNRKKEIQLQKQEEALKLLQQEIESKKRILEESESTITKQGSIIQSMEGDLSKMESSIVASKRAVGVVSTITAVVTATAAAGLTYLATHSS